MSQPLFRHIAACNNTPSPNHLLPFRFGPEQVGWVSAELGRALTFFPRDFHFEGRGISMAGRLRTPGMRSDALAATVRELAKQGFGRVRGELFDIRAEANGPVLGTLDRGAIPQFGVIGQGVHLNGLVRRADGLHVWIGIRSKDKAVAPGQVDNLVAGGIPAGLTAEETLLKEAGEEASLLPELAVTARRVARLSYILTNNEGLRRDVLHVFDLELPESFVPTPNDDEVERFELWPIARVLEVVRETEDVKFNVNLVLIDLFLREGLVDPASAEGQALRAGLDQGP